MDVEGLASDNRHQERSAVGDAHEFGACPKESSSSLTPQPPSNLRFPPSSKSCDNFQRDSNAGLRWLAKGDR